MKTRTETLLKKAQNIGVLHGFRFRRRKEKTLVSFLEMVMIYFDVLCFDAIFIWHEQ